MYNNNYYFNCIIKYNTKCIVTKVEECLDLLSFLNDHKMLKINYMFIMKYLNTKHYFYNLRNTQFQMVDIPCTTATISFSKCTKRTIFSFISQLPLVA